MPEKKDNRLYAYLWPFVTGWFVFLVVCIAVQVCYFGQPWQPSVIDCLKGGSIMVACAYIIHNVLRFYHPSQGRYVFVITFSLLLTLLWWGAYQLVLPMLMNYPAYLDFAVRMLPMKLLFVWLVNLFLLVCGMMWYHIEEQRQVKEREQATERLARDAELLKLRQQLQPHFLFNSLNSISALVTMDPEQARKMVHQLSDFMRGTLKTEDQQLSSFAEELQYLRLYLEIEKVRFGHRLEVNIDEQSGISDMKLPSLVLQPLLENAIKYGLYGTTGKVSIGIKAYVENGLLVVSMSNPYEKDSQPSRGTGFGLSSVKRRLYLLFGRNDLVSVNQDKDVFTVLVKIPQPL